VYSAVFKRIQGNTMEEKYYYSKTLRTILTLAPFLFVLPFIVMFLAGDLPAAIACGAVILTLPLFFILKKINEPVIELSNNGIILRTSLLSKGTSAAWNEIEGMATYKIQVNVIVKIYKKTCGNSPALFNISLKSLQRPDDVLKILKAKIPANKGFSNKQLDECIEHPISSEIQHREWKLTENGLSKAEEMIPWKSVTQVACRPNPGLPYLLIDYRDNGNNEKTITIKPPFSSGTKNTKHFRAFIAYMVRHACEANIDPGLIALLRTPAKETSSDQWCIAALICGFIVSLFVSMVLMYYAPFSEVLSRSLFSMCILFVCLAPCMGTVILFASQAQGKKILAAKKIKWSLLCPLTAPLVFLIVCFAFPFSSAYMTGDLHLKFGYTNEAEHYYLKALQESPDNIDVSFDMGLLYKDTGDYEAASHYFEKAYLKDPQYWLADAAVMLPDTLIKMKRYEDALAWCNKILDEHPGDTSFKKTFEDTIKKINGLLKNKKE